MLTQLQAAATDSESRQLVSDIRAELGALQSKLQAKAQEMLMASEEDRKVDD